MFKVDFTTPAENDLVSVLRYISDVLKAPSAAESLLEEIEKQVKTMEENPYIFSIVKDDYLGEKGI